MAPKSIGGQGKEGSTFKGLDLEAKTGLPPSGGRDGGTAFRK